MLLRFLVTCVLVSSILAACASHEETKDTPETRCQRICATPTTGPCTGKSDDACTSSCLARLTGKPDACQSCLHAHSGWKGVSCSCDKALGGFGSLTCETCNWLGAGQSCAGGTSGNCSTVAQGCTGLVIAPVGEPACASQCGEAPATDGGT